MRGAPGGGGKPGARIATDAPARVAADYDNPVRRRWRAERARRELVLGSIRAALAEEPSAAARRAAARRWTAAVWGLVDELAEEARQSAA